MADRLDIIIFGATGFTGKHCIGPVVKMSKAHGRNLTWGVAGRSAQSLSKVLSEEGVKLGQDLNSIPIIIADLKNEQSLKNMAQRAKVIVNCCGPYRFYGKPVVQACIEAGTHQVDVSGEPQYIEQTQLDYAAAAAEKNIYVVSACGFDSIPSDLGIVYLEQNFEGTLNSVETYLKSWSEGSASGPAVNYGTWDSAVHGMPNVAQLKELRRKLYPTQLPKFSPKLKLKSIPHKGDVEDGWVVPFMGSDKSVCRRSQRFFYEREEKRPIQVETYFMISSFFYLIIMAFFGGIFLILTKFSFGRKLLLRYPSIFSAGFFSHENPSEETINNSCFSITLNGEGWREKLTNADDQYSTPVNQRVVAKVRGRNPGYGATCVALVLSAVMILTEKDKLPKSGGVYSPGYCFAKTSIIKELNENGLTFEIVSRTDI